MHLCIVDERRAEGHIDETEKVHAKGWLALEPGQRPTALAVGFKDYRRRD